MKAVIFFGGVMGGENIDRPTAMELGMVVQMQAIGVCGLDLPPFKTGFGRMTIGIGPGPELSGSSRVRAYHVRIAEAMKYT